MDERIIDCVRNRELLYNRKLMDYKNASRKQEAWDQIAAELNITATECKSKWNLLRNAFIHAMSRRKTVTGQGVKNFKKWKFEDEMAFLLPFMANRNTIAAPLGEFSHETTESPGAGHVRAPEGRGLRESLHVCIYVKMDERIIECVRNRELLYNHKLKDYKNASKKKEAWEQIAAELNITATECKTKWNLLRNAFIHAMSRRKAVTGQGVKNFKKWKFEDEMAFLLPFMANRNTIAAPVGKFSHETTESPGEDIIEEYLNGNKTKQKKRHLDNYHEDLLKLMKARSQRRSEKNDIELFFNSIAETVKKFPKLEQVKLKFKIMNMVHEIEMKMCLESDTASISTNISTPPHFNRHKFSPHNFSPSPESFDTHYSLSPPVTHQVSYPQFVPQSSPSP